MTGESRTTRPLSGKGSAIRYRRRADGSIRAIWGSAKLSLNASEVGAIMLDFFADPGAWYILGASMTDPVPEGLGEFVNNRFQRLSPRHASAIAAILVNEGCLVYCGSRPIKLRRL